MEGEERKPQPYKDTETVSKKSRVSARDGRGVTEPAPGGSAQDRMPGFLSVWPRKWRGRRGNHSPTRTLRLSGGEAQGTNDSPEAKGTHTKMFQHVNRRVRIWRATFYHAPPADCSTFTALHVAARNINTAFMCLLLEAGADKDALNSARSTPLQIAAIEGHVAATEVLSDADADATIRNGSNKSTAMEWAASKGHAGVVQALIRRGVDVNAAGPTGLTALHEAARRNNVGVMRLLLGAGADKNTLLRTGCTPLHIAAIEGHLAATEVLLNADADATLRYGWNNSTAMEWAAFKGHAGVVQALVRHGVDVNATGPTGLTALHEAARRNHVEVMRLLLEAGADKNALFSTGCTPLHKAAIQGHLAATEVLLNADADATLRYGPNNSTAMEWAAFKGHAGVVQTLIRHGVDVNAAGPIGLTALHEAARKNHVEVMRLLLEAGADKNALFSSGSTPLFLAAIQGHLAATEFLVDADADATLRYGWKRLTAMEWAALTGHAGVVQALIRRGVDLNAVGPSGTTALNEAVRGDHVDVVEYLLDAGANADPQCRSGFTTLHLASSSGARQATLALLKNGASVSQRDKEGCTPLHRGAKAAGKQGVAECVYLMLRWGADEKAVDNTGQTAADLIGRDVDGNELLPEEFERVRKLLESAQADRSWRRRGLMILGRAYPDRLGLPAEGSSRHVMMVPKTGANNVPSDAQANGVAVTGGFLDDMAGDDFGSVVAVLLGLPIDGVFRHVVGYL